MAECERYREGALDVYGGVDDDLVAVLSIKCQWRHRTHGVSLLKIYISYLEQYFQHSQASSLVRRPDRFVLVSCSRLLKGNIFAVVYKAHALATPHRRASEP